ncbi:hypothetical protein GGD66_006837 [Bradyrhizobium sp. CIR48]|nr:hypothetical protein [Bradyrhizobium sp. CIR48]
MRIAASVSTFTSLSNNNFNASVLKLRKRGNVQVGSEMGSCAAELLAVAHCGAREGLDVARSGKLCERGIVIIRKSGMSLRTYTAYSDF